MILLLADAIFAQRGAADFDDTDAFRAMLRHTPPHAATNIRYEYYAAMMFRCLLMAAFDTPRCRHYFITLA